MYGINEIEIKHIANLEAIKLSELLHLLLRIEAENNRLEDWDRSVPFNINTGDAGSDGRITWKGNPSKTYWLPNKYTIFQNKATKLIQSKCKEELLEKVVKGMPRKLKKQILKLADKNGCYVLFTTQPIVDQGIEERVDGFRSAFQEVNHPNALSIIIKVYDANKIKDWVNKHVSAITLVQRFNGIHRPKGFRIWEEWERSVKGFENEFQVDETISNNLCSIREALESHNVLRIYGHSGLGKTRLVLEAFRGSIMKNLLVYYDLEGIIDVSAIKDYLISYQNSQQGIIVIDNCDIEKHSILSSQVKFDGNIKIITIGLDDDRSVEDLKIKLDRNKQRDLVRKIIINKISKTHPKSDVEYTTTLSEGYPWMAVRFCDEILKQGIIELNKIPINQFIKKLIFGSGEENEIEHDVIRACSVFSAFGFLDDSFRNVLNKEYQDSLKKQTDFIRTEVYDGEIRETKFNEICNKFLRKDIIERKGTYYIVKPTILAINLAANWLLNTPPDRIIRIIEKLKDVNLEKEFIERFTDLDQIDKAKDIVAELWGPNGPFGTAEVLNFSWGSLLFRYVVEVNPVATSKTLERTFSSMSTQELLKVDKGRRNLVWALEKLCFRRESFNRAAKILFAFAVAENETWANNATNQFIHLFQIVLPGTEVNFKERLKIIRWGLDKKDDSFTKIAIQAMGRGFMNDHFVRSGGAHKQGSGTPLKDYHPVSLEEIVSYREEFIDLLTKIACSQNPNSDLAQEKIAGAIRILTRDGQFDLINKSIRKISTSKGNVWPEALNSLKKTLNFEKHLPEEVVQNINNTIKELTPNNLKEQLFLTVTKPEWSSYEKDGEGRYIDKPRLKAEELAQKIINENAPWIEYMSDLLTGEQRQAFAFGKKLAELNFDVNQFVNTAIPILERIPKENQNSELLAGFVAGSNGRELFEKTLNLIVNNPKIQHHSFHFTRVNNATYNDLIKLFILVDRYDSSISNFKIFQYGRALENLSSEEMEKLCDKVNSYGNTGKWISLSLLYMFCYNDEQKWNKHRDYIKSLISSENITIEMDEVGKTDHYHWSDSVAKILNSNTEKDFAVIIAKQIVEFCSQPNFNYSFDVYMRNSIRLLMDKYFEDTWEIFGDGLIGDYLTYFNLKNLIGSRNETGGGKPGIAFNNDNNNTAILEWCRKHPEIAPKRIANMMPLTVGVDNKETWHPFSKAIIDEFGNDEDFLNELSANMGTFGTVGSSVPYFVTMKNLLQELIDHKIAQVQLWAELRLEYTEKQIKLETLDDEQRDL